MNFDLFEGDHENPLLTVLSFGCGQDSSCILFKIIYDEQFRTKYVPNDLIVVFADTGNEFPETYEYLSFIKKVCIKHNIEFIHILPEMGFHTGDWTSLENFYETNSAVGSKAFRKICSQRLKIDVIYRYIEAFLHERYGVQIGKKKGIRQFAKEHGKIRMIIGIAASEERRTSIAADRKERWYAESIVHSYPLIEIGFDRKLCQDYIASTGNPIPIPSNCVFCPFLSIEELEYIRRFHSEALERWVYYEKKKLNKWSHLDAVEITLPSGKTKIENKNLGVFGKRYLPEMIEKASEQFKDWSDERIRNYRFSHGHCVATSY